MKTLITKQRKPIFVKSFFGLAFVLVSSIFLMIRGTKDKTGFEHVTGHLISINSAFQELTHGNNQKFRYLILDNYAKAFEIFVGKDWGDFKPKYERIDELNKGDLIDVYFDPSIHEDDSRISKLVQFIDKSGQPYFIRGDSDKTMGAVGLVFSVLFAALLFYLKQLGKII